MVSEASGEGVGSGTAAQWRTRHDHLAATMVENEKASAEEGDKRAASMRELAERLQKRNKDVDELQKERGSHLKELQARQAKIDKLEDDLIEARTARDRFRDQLSDARADVHENNKNYQEQRERAATLQMEWDHAKTRIEVLESRVLSDASDPGTPNEASPSTSMHDDQSSNGEQWMIEQLANRLETVTELAQRLAVAVAVAIDWPERAQEPSEMIGEPRELFTEELDEYRRIMQMPVPILDVFNGVCGRLRDPDREKEAWYRKNQSGRE